MTKHKHNAQSYKENNPLQTIKPIQKIQPKYHPSVASVYSSMTKSTCIFPKTLNKCINACMENTSKQK